MNKKIVKDIQNVNISHYLPAIVHNHHFLQEALTLAANDD